MLPGPVCGTPIYTAEPGKSSSSPGLFFTISLRRSKSGGLERLTTWCKSLSLMSLRVLVAPPADSCLRPFLPKSLVSLGKMNRWTVGIGGFFIAPGRFGGADPWGWQPRPDDSLPFPAPDPRPLDSPRHAMEYSSIPVAARAPRVCASGLAPAPGLRGPVPAVRRGPECENRGTDCQRAQAGSIPRGPRGTGLAAASGSRSGVGSSPPARSCSRVTGWRCVRESGRVARQVGGASVAGHRRAIRRSPEA